MQTENSRCVLVQNHIISSLHLNREVLIDFYIPSNIQYNHVSLLLINDGQDLVRMGFENILEDLYGAQKLKPLLCAGIHCGPDRRNEYGTAAHLDFKGRGSKAIAYNRFIFEELLPFTRKLFAISSFIEKSFCGFSLGGLSALDIVWNHPVEFSRVGVFSGSLWWRSVGQDDILFDENKHRIMHMQIRNGGYYPWLKFFFETGSKDETADRNNNGIIDAIDDTLSCIEELVLKGYSLDSDIIYLEMKDGKHDVPTWAEAFPAFLQWGWDPEER
ncbi:MAG: alpha/beta hydrolase-fold protein [Ginsengibacter sp.]